MKLFAPGSTGGTDVPPGSVILFGTNGVVNISTPPAYAVTSVTMADNQELVISTAANPPTDLNRIVSILTAAGIPAPVYTSKDATGVLGDWASLVPTAAAALVPAYAPNFDFGVLGVWLFDANGKLVGSGHYEPAPVPVPPPA